RPRAALRRSTGRRCGPDRPAPSIPRWEHSPANPGHRSKTPGSQPGHARIAAPRVVHARHPDALGELSHVAVLLDHRWMVRLLLGGFFRRVVHATVPPGWGPPRRRRCAATARGPRDED